jgi:apolipoprotein N-acyltransferase
MIGYSQFDTPLLRLAAWGGVIGVSAAVVAINASVTALVLHRRPVSLVVLLVVLGFVVFVPIPGSEPTGKTFRVGIAQGWFPTVMYTIADFDVATRSEIARRYSRLVNQLEVRGADLIVLPETAFGGWQGDLTASRDVRSALSGASFALAGAKVASADGAGYNAVLEWQREANLLGVVYAKRYTILGLLKKVDT